METTIKKIEQTAYDLVPYASYSFPLTHPDKLATIATLLGLDPPDIEQCRVLELGCASGGNIIPMAYTLPGSTFVGVDFAAQHVAAGQPMIEALGLKNISLQHMDILDIPPDFGQFDYIIAHGVYSWVPPAVQDKILAICGQHLAPNGVAYISYNTYPGWRLHSVVRDMMRYHTEAVTDPQTRIVQAREILDFMAESVLSKSNVHAKFLHSYLNYVKERFLPPGDDAYLFHNELADFNEPLYFHEFIDRAGRHGLKYLAEAQFQTMLASNLPAEAAKTLQRLAKDTIALEQYMDFLRNRIFRQTLLCHQEAPLRGRLLPERLARFYMASSALPEEAAAIDSHAEAVVKFKAPNGDHFSTNHPVTKAALLYLSEMWPQAVPFKALLATAYERLGLSPDSLPVETVTADRQLLGANLVQAYSYNEDLVEFHIFAPPLVTSVGEKPILSPVARLQARQGERVTNLRHELLKLTGFNHYLASYLNGDWSRAALLEIIERAIEAGQLEIERDETAVADPEQIQATLPALIEKTLQELANAGLMVA